MRDYYMPEEFITDAMVVTNADRIRAMSDEELAKWLLDMMSHKVACFGEGAFPYTPCRNEEHDCVKCGIEWLKQPQPEPPKEEAKQDCTYNKNGHCIGQKLMPECDAKNCDRKKH